MTERISQSISLNESLIFEKAPGNRSSFQLPVFEEYDKSVEQLLPAELIRTDDIDLPDLNEVEVMRHYTRLSTYNYHLDLGLYPLGSCTMKYNPRMNEVLSKLPQFIDLHPFSLHEISQGSLKLYKKLQDLLVAITGLDGVTLQPLAGAHGELTGMMLIRATLTHRGNPRKIVLIPDSAHGTNPASATLCGYKAVTLKSNDEGNIDLDELSANLNEDVACLMLTNPNTLGVFEKNIKKIADMLHENGSLLYMDGANFNAFMGKARPGDMGIDVMHLNLHKTFSTPHGGGGPGSGPVVVKEEIIPFLPVPVINSKEDGTFFLDYNRPQSIGKVATFYGNFSVLIKALAYIVRLGGDGLRQAAENAVLNANYIRSKLKDILHLEYDQPTLHEVVFDDKNQSVYDVTTLDMAKRLLDHGFHPPTIYFPLIVHGAIMIEPTETEPVDELDAFIEAFKEIVNEAENSSENLHNAPSMVRNSRFDETLAARKPVLVWKREQNET